MVAHNLHCYFLTYLISFLNYWHELYRWYCDSQLRFSVIFKISTAIQWYHQSKLHENGSHPVALNLMSTYVSVSEHSGLIDFICPSRLHKLVCQSRFHDFVCLNRFHVIIYLNTLYIICRNKFHDFIFGADFTMSE